MIECWKFQSEHCAPCKAVQPKLQKFCKDKGIKLIELDISEHNITARDRMVRSVPTMILLKDGNELTRCIGTNFEENFKEYV